MALQWTMIVTMLAIGVSYAVFIRRRYALDCEWRRQQGYDDTGFSVWFYFGTRRQITDPSELFDRMDDSVLDRLRRRALISFGVLIASPIWGFVLGLFVGHFIARAVTG